MDNHHEALFEHLTIQIQKNPVFNYLFRSKLIFFLNENKSVIFDHFLTSFGGSSR